MTELQEPGTPSLTDEQCVEIQAWARHVKFRTGKMVLDWLIKECKFRASEVEPWLEQHGYLERRQGEAA